MLDVEHQFRGCMYWNANLDDGPCWFPNGTTVTCDFAAGFNSFLGIR